MEIIDYTELSFSKIGACHSCGDSEGQGRPRLDTHLGGTSSA
jgi:hypothetical protein